MVAATLWRMLNGQSAAALRLKQTYHRLRSEAERAVPRDQLRPNSCPVCGGRGPATLANPLGMTFAVCPQDGTVYADPAPAEEALLRLQNDPSQAYPFLRGRKVGGVQVAPLRDELLALERLLPQGLTPQTRLLDVGCGTGGFLLAARTRCETHGIEPHAAAAEVARAQGLAVTPGRFEDLVPSGRFDLVSFVCVLEHSARPGALLEAARQWISPGGHVYVVTPNIGSASFAHLQAKHSHLSSLSNVSLFTQHSLRLLAERSGFRVVAQTVGGGRDLSLSDLVTFAVAPDAFRHRMSFYRPTVHTAFALAEQLVPRFVERRLFPEGEPTFQRALLAAS